MLLCLLGDLVSFCSSLMLLLVSLDVNFLEYIHDYIGAARCPFDAHDTTFENAELFKMSTNSSCAIFTWVWLLFLPSDVSFPLNPSEYCCKVSLSVKNQI